MEVIHTENAPTHVVPVPQASAVRGWIYVSALIGADPVDRVILEGVSGRAQQIFDNLVAILAAGVAELTDVVRAGIVMRDLHRDRPDFDKVWAERFGDHRPARVAIQSAEFGRTGENAKIMIEVTAFRGWPRRCMRMASSARYRPRRGAGPPSSCRSRLNSSPRRLPGRPDRAKAELTVSARDRQGRNGSPWGRGQCGREPWCRRLRQPGPTEQFGHAHRQMPGARRSAALGSRRRVTN